MTPDGCRYRPLDNAANRERRYARVLGYQLAQRQAVPIGRLPSNKPRKGYAQG
jgi:hypothetical protein